MDTQTRQSQRTRTRITLCKPKKISENIFRYKPMGLAIKPTAQTIKGPDSPTCYVFPKCPHTCTVCALYGCDYRAPRCTECSACHDFGNGIAKVLRLPRFRKGIAKVLRLPRFRTPPAARATTSCPSRQLPNATPATQTHTQMHRMLRLPRLRQRHRQSAAPATISQRHRQSAAPATISHTPRRARDNILSL